MGGAGRTRPTTVLERAAASLDWWDQRAAEPTSSILGTGAIAELERLGPPTLGHALGLALPSATIALRVALAAVGVVPGDEVVVPALDWGAGRAAATSLGAHAVAADPTRPAGLVDARTVAASVTERTRAVVVTHLAGAVADVAAIRAALPAGVAVVEDCAQALGGRRGAAPAGSVGDVAVASFGPGKVVDAGEAGLLATSSDLLLHRAVRSSQHPAGCLTRGVVPPEDPVLTTRVHPVAAVMACHALAGLPTELDARRRARAEVARRLGRAGTTVDPAVVEGSAGPGLSVEAAIEALDPGLIARPLASIDPWAGAPARQLLDGCALVDLSPTFPGSPGTERS